MKSILAGVLLVGSFAGLASAQEIRPPLQFTGEKALPKAILNAPYETKLGVSGGIPPWTWEIIDGDLPQGLNLDPTKGVIAGKATAPGQYRFAVEVSDSDDPPDTRTREFTITVTSALTVEWIKAPAVTQNGISGSLKLSNNTADDVDLTMIVVAVNEVGKAFVLGYQHFAFDRDSSLSDIGFGSTLPQGSYVVHADVIGEVIGKISIYRARLQTSAPLSTP